MYNYIFFENKTTRPIYVVLLAVHGRLEIHPYDQPVPTAITLVPGKAQRVTVDKKIASCIDGKGLNFYLHSHMKATQPSTYFQPARDYHVDDQGEIDGPIFLFATLSD